MGSPIHSLTFTDRTIGKWAAGVSAYRNNTVYDYYVNGEFDFFACGAGTDNSLADFILGIPSQYFQYPHAPSNIRSKSYYGFLQDEWRVSKRLTLDLGIRYEYNSPKEDTEGRSFSIIPGLQSTVFTGAPTEWFFPEIEARPWERIFPIGRTGDRAWVSRGIRAATPRPAFAADSECFMTFSKAKIICSSTASRLSFPVWV